MQDRQSSTWRMIMALVLSELPYQRDELAPTISGETTDYHYGKHHNAYVTNLNRLVEGTELRERSLEEIVAESDGVLFNNAAHVWNHTFYWNCLSPQGGGRQKGCFWKPLRETSVPMKLSGRPLSRPPPR